MSGPSITTIVPTFRRPLLLRRAVLSILNQSCGDFRVLILDNASGDETEQVASELVRCDARVAYHRHPQNIGSLQNMIFGMEQVQTPFFSILCDDDLLMPSFYETALEAHGDGVSAFAATRVLVVDDRGAFGDPWPHPAQPTRYEPPGGAVRCLRFGLSMPGVLFRTAAMRDVGPPRIPWWNWTESGWTALAALRSPISFAPAVGAIVYVHPGSRSKRMDRAEFRVSWFRMIGEVRRVALAGGVEPSWWNRHVHPLVRGRFLSTVARLSNADGTGAFPELAQVSSAAGVPVSYARALVTAGRMLAASGLGGALNALAERVVRDGADAGPPAAEARRLAGVFADLNRQAGLTVAH